LHQKFELVTVGAGYIGSHTVVSLIENGLTPIIVDDFWSSTPQMVQNIETLTQQKIIVYNSSYQDSAALNKIFEHYPIWGVIHFAAYKAVGESIDNPIKYFDNNISGLITLLSVMVQNLVFRLVFSSSCAVYGNSETMPVVDDLPKGYISPYGFTKLVNEQMLEQIYERYPQFKIVALRYFNPLGAHSSGLIGESPLGVPNNLFPYITQTAILRRKELIVFGNDYNTPYGTNVRDYIHVVDLAEAHLAAIRYTQ
jgi:UDP-glucose 4-epimerase